MNEWITNVNHSENDDLPLLLLAIVVLRQKQKGWWRTAERFSLEFVFMMDKSRKKKMDGKMQVLQDARHSLDKQNELSYHAPKSQPLIWWTCGPTSQEMEMCQKLVNKEVDEMNDLWKMERQWKIIVHYQNQEKYKN